MKRNFLISIVIILLISSTFSSLRHADFVWDDFRNFIENPHIKILSLKSIFHFFTTIENDNYFPLTWISISLNYQFWKSNPLGYHLCNIFLHIISSLIFFFLTQKILEFCEIRKKKIIYGASMLSVLLFSLHPLRVETVAWISTRGDLLCAIFLQLSLISYIYHIRNHQNQKISFAFPLALSIIFCFLSFLCRAWALTFPFVLLIVDFFYRRKFSQITFIEKLPFLLLSAIFAIPAFLARSSGMPNLATLGVLQRIILALHNFTFYVISTIFPCNLSPLYPLENFSPLAQTTIIYAVIAISTLVYLLFNHFRFRSAFCALYAYMLILLPVSGIVQSGIQYAADRYTYISTMPLYIFFCAGIAKFAEKHYSKREFYFGRAIVLILVFLPLFVFPQLSYHQTKIWMNEYTLWTHVIDSGNKCSTAFYNRGLYLAKFAENLPKDEYFETLKKAKEDFNRAISIAPKDINAMLNRGIVSFKLGQYLEAIEQFTKILELAPAHIGALSNRALAYERIENFEEAKNDLYRILEIKKNNKDAGLRLANIYIKMKKYEDAKKILDALITKDKNFAEAYANRGALNLLTGNIQEAKEDLLKALSLNPHLQQVKENLHTLEEGKK